MTNPIQQITKTIKNWWLFLVYGVLLIAFAIWVLMTPEESYIGLALAFAVLVLINAISHISFAISNRKLMEGWGWFLASGILELIVGIVLVANPGLSMITLPFVVGFWLLIRSGFLMGTALDLRRYGFLDWGWLMLLSIGLGIFSFLIIVNPAFGALTVVSFTGVALLFFGISYVWLSFKLKKLKAMTLDKVDDWLKAFRHEAENFKSDLMKSIESGIQELDDEAGKMLDDAASQIDGFIDQQKKELE